MPSFTNAHQLSEWSDYVQIGLRQVFEDTLPQQPKLYGPWLKEVQAKDWIENKVVNTGLGAMPTKEIGGEFHTDKKINSTKVAFELAAYGLATVMEYELVQWDKYDVFTEMTKELAKAAIDRLNIIGYSVLNNGFGTTTNYTIYNGEAIFNTAHVRLDGGAWKNRPTTDTSLSYLALQQAKIDLATLVNERGRYLRVTGKQLIVHPANRWVAETLIKSTLRPGTANNDANTIQGEFEIHDSPFLTDEENFFVWGNKSDVQIELRLGKDGGPVFRQYADPRSWNVIQQAYMSVGLAVLHSQGAWGSSP